MNATNLRRSGAILIGAAYAAILVAVVHGLVGAFNSAGATPQYTLGQTCSLLGRAVMINNISTAGGRVEYTVVTQHGATPRVSETVLEHCIDAEVAER